MRRLLLAALAVATLGVVAGPAAAMPPPGPAVRIYHDQYGNACVQYAQFAPVCVPATTTS